MFKYKEQITGQNQRVSERGCTSKQRKKVIYGREKHKNRRS